jgi:hypothetical protein
MNGNKSCTANFVDKWADWYPGIASTVLAGKHIYKTDLSSVYYYETSSAAIVSPQGATGLDPNWPANMVLVSPQTNPNVDFSKYPAQNACKAIGGRLPNTQELSAVYAGRATYGNNFQMNGYWSATEWGNGGGAFGFNFNNGTTFYGYETGPGYVRCISG